MEDLRLYFSSESIEKLKLLNEDLRNSDAFSELERSELFRMLHTVKGSSQTFGFDSASRLAHNLESFLSTVRRKEDFDETTKNLFLEGIELLIKSLEEKHFKVPATFLEKIFTDASDSIEKKDFSEEFLQEIPPEISAQLSNQEKTALASALSFGKNLYGLEIGFDLPNFAAEFRKLREVLNESSEIIATLPSAKHNAKGKIGFQIFFASSLETAQVKKLAESSAAEMILDVSGTVFSSDLQGVLSQVVKHGKTIAKSFGKKIEFETSAESPELSARKLKLIFDVLTHLTRNGVDHAIESEGKIKINFEVEGKNLKLTVSDDGRGIDSEKIKAKAVEKNLISADKNLSEQETLDLIFKPEFSTASELTEISGRGIGLDAVKVAIESEGGKISVKTRIGKGTTFEIFLPRE